MNKVLIYSTPNDAPKIQLTKSQIDALRKARLWPHDSHGVAYCCIGKPFSPGQPTWTDDEVALFINAGIRPSLPHKSGNEGEKVHRIREKPFLGWRDDKKPKEVVAELTRTA
jgi:hypothetical protein